jgi:hypothetical protein
VVPVDGFEEVGAALDEADERAHRQLDALGGEVATQPVERHKHRELLP